MSSNPSSHVLAGIEVQLQSGLCHCQEMLEKAIHAFQTIDAPDFTENEVFRLCSLNDDTQESPMYSDEDVST